MFFVAVASACSPSGSGYGQYSPPGPDASSARDAKIFDDAAPDAFKAKDAPPERSFTCESCEPVVQMIGSGSGAMCQETITLELACTGGYMFPSGDQRVTTVDGSGSDSTTLDTETCGSTFPAFTLAVGSSNTCADADVIHFAKIQTSDLPSIEVDCTYAATCE
jgi:hypothetical protein